MLVFQLSAWFQDENKRKVVPGWLRQKVRPYTKYIQTYINKNINKYPKAKRAGDVTKVAECLSSKSKA